jgi:hypothetical protein
VARPATSSTSAPEGSAHGWAWYLGGFDDGDVTALERAGGHFIPRAEGPAYYLGGAESIWFSRAIDDVALAAVAPSLSDMHPGFLDLYNQPITDASIEIINGIDGVRAINVDGTLMTPEGLKKLKPARVAHHFTR